MSEPISKIQSVNIASGIVWKDVGERIDRIVQSFFMALGVAGLSVGIILYLKAESVDTNITANNKLVPFLFKRLEAQGWGADKIRALNAPKPENKNDNEKTVYSQHPHLQYLKNANPIEKQVLSEILIPDDIQICDKDVCGLEKIQCEIQKVLNHENSDDMFDYALANYYGQNTLATQARQQQRSSTNNTHRSPLSQGPKGMLFAGPPGTGKTLLMKLIAKENPKYAVFNIKASTFKKKWFGESEQIVASVFKAARALAPSIIFLDEIDRMVNHTDSQSSTDQAIMAEFLSQWDGINSDSGGSFGTKEDKKEAKKQNDTRDVAQELIFKGNNTTNNTTNSKSSDVSQTKTKEQIDGWSTSNEVLVIGTTNHESRLDPALARRLSLKFTFTLPSKKERKTLIERHISQTQLIIGEKFDWDNLLQQTENFSGSDLLVLCQSAILNAREEFIEKSIVLTQFTHFRKKDVKDDTKDMSLSSTNDLSNTRNIDSREYSTAYLSASQFPQKWIKKSIVEKPTLVKLKVEDTTVHPWVTTQHFLNALDQIKPNSHDNKSFHSMYI